MKLGSFLAGCAFLIASSAQAVVISSSNGLLTYDGPDFVDFETNNDFYGAGKPLAADSQYGIGGTLTLNATSELTFTYLGFEAGYDNDFTAYGETFSNRNGNGTDATAFGATINAIADDLVFSFWSHNVNSGVDETNVQTFLNNGDNQSFAVMLDALWNGVMYDAILLFDDSGAANDDNHDDLIVGLNAVAVPEPATLALLALGLFGLAVARRRV